MTDKIVSAPLDALFQSFLDSKKKSTSETYRSAFALWVNYTKMNGKESLRFKKEDDDAKTEKLILAFHKHLLETGKSPNTAKTLVGGIRGFYTENRLSLLFTDSETKILSKAKRTTKDYKFSKEDLAKMSEVGNLEERYIVLVGKSIGLRAGDFLKLTFGDFRSIHINEDAPISLGEIETQKEEEVKAYPFLDSDAVKIVKAILEANPTAKASEKVLKLGEQSLTIAIQRLVKKAQIEHGNSLVRFHCLRKYLIDRLSANCGESQWKQIIGKAISEGAYVSQDQLRDIYLKAMPSIIVNGNGKTLVKVEMLEQALAQSEDERRATNTRLEQALARIEEMQKKQDNTMQKVLSLPTIAREFRNQKEKAFDVNENPT